MPVDEDVLLSQHPALRESDITPSPDQRHLLYARGYLLTRTPVDLDLGEHWGRLRFGDRHLTWDRRTPLVLAEHQQVTVLLLGRVVHPRRGTADPAVVAEHLVRARARGREAYARELDEVVGRYVVLDRGPEGTTLQTDAAAMRSCYHDATASVLASHSRLAAETVGDPRPSRFPVDWLRRTRALTYPGRYTDFAGIHLLTPSTELRLEDARISRTGPLPVTELVSASLAAKRLLPRLQDQLTLLAEGAPPLISLTGGLDSRTTLALSRPIADRAEYFTFVRPYLGEADDSVADLRTARELAATFGLHHTTVPVEGPLVPGPLASVMGRNIARQHGRSVSAAYREVLPPDRVHVRSNLYEVGRAVYLRRGYTGELTPQVMAETLVARGSEPPEPAVVEAFEEWVDATSFAAPEGVDAYDMFYWEHRMAAWLNSHLTESDIAHDTHILVNSRAIFRHLLSVSQGQRRWGKVFDHLVRLSWPEVYDIPVNGRDRSVPEEPARPAPAPTDGPAAG
ncbi:hypothetical protein [Desertihabitans aurantiacus]|uniref:hypothetical protein n=1 Tax=Desertihabitans aurantiacus TaxID=2282477 RepID=UPI000DF86A7E|nr:hypothetical protein [Desertihabitans aurantiacus]